MQLTIRPLEPVEARRAFPLIQSHDSLCTLEQWCDYTAALERPREHMSGGTMAAQDDHGYVHGLFTYQVVPHLRAGQVLQIDHFIPLEMLRAQAVGHALLAAMEELARRLRCRRIAIEVPARRLPATEPDHPAIALLDHAGHELATARLVRPL